MFDDQVSDNRVYVVLINGEDQYSLWPHNQDVPAGWRSVDFVGSRDACMKYVDEVWTDQRPKSLRKKMQAVQ